MEIRIGTITGFGENEIHTEVERDSAKVKVWCGFMRDRVIPLFFLRQPTVTGALFSYLDVLELATCSCL
jgi:hypothetical protein